MAAGDLTRDGKVDVAVALSLSGQVVVLRGDGAGGLVRNGALAITYGPAQDQRPGQLTGLAIGDVDGASGPDVVATANLPGNADGAPAEVVVLANDGSGGLSVRSRMGTLVDPRTPVLGDFDANGRLDLAWATGGAAIHVHHGNGAGQFAAHATVSTGGSPQILAMSDLDGDSRLDLAVASTTGAAAGGTVQLFRGTAAGSFEAGPSTIVGPGPAAAVAADFTGDGVPDLVVVNRQSNDAMLLAGSGTGTFVPALSFSTRGGPASAAAGDFDGDGYPDFVVGGASGLVAFRGAPEAVPGRTVAERLFQPRQDFGPPNPNTVFRFDFDADGLMDLVVGRHAPAHLAFWKGNGAGTFQETLDLDLNSYVVTDLAFADFNRDGKMDFAAALHTGSVGMVRIGLGNGAGGFTLLAPFQSASTESFALSVGDLNRDGIPDLVAGNYDNSEAYGTVCLFLGSGDGTFQAPRPILRVGEHGPRRVRVVDFDGDGVPDVLTALSAEREVALLRGDGLGGFTTTRFPAASRSGDPIQLVSVTDVDGDGRPDLVLSSSGYPTNGGPVINRGSVMVALQNGVGGLGPMAEYAIPPDIFAEGGFIGDVDGDGITDLGIVGRGEGGPQGGASLTALYRGNGRGGFFSLGWLAMGGHAGDELVVEDFNRDGAPELAGTGGGSGLVSIFLGRPRVTADQPGGATQIDGERIGRYLTKKGTTSAGDASGAILVDMNGDGHLDAVLTGTGSHMFQIMLGDGTGVMGSPTTFNLEGAPAQAIAASDLDGDGKIDLVTPVGGGVAIGLGDGAGGLREIRYVELGVAGNMNVAGLVGDVNGDGKPDLLATIEADGNVRVLLNRGDATFDVLPGQRLSDQVIHSARLFDYNGDGKLDLVFAKHISTLVVLARGNGDGTFTIATTFDVGDPVLPSGEPAYTGLGIPQDLDHDGSIEIPINQGGNQQWHKARIKMTSVRPDGSFTAPRPIAILDSGCYPPRFTDVNFDGRPDMVILRQHESSSQGILVLFVGRRDGSFLKIGESPTGNVFPAGMPEFGDLNEDGSLDVVVTNNATGVGTVVTYLNRIPPPRAATGDPVLGPVSRLFGLSNDHPVNEPHDVKMADLDGDGNLDMLVTSVSTGQVGLFAGNGRGGFASPAGFRVGSRPRQLAVGDLNKDGKPDAVVANEGSNSVSILLNNGAGGFAPPRDVAVGYGPYSVTLGDFNRDSNLDAIVNDGAGAQAVVLSGDGAGNLARTGTLTAGQDMGSLAAGDFDGDGAADIAVGSRRTGVDTVFVARGGAALSAVDPPITPPAPSELAVDDLDGNGIPDLAAVSTGDGTVSVLLGDGSGTFLPTSRASPSAPRYAAGLSPAGVAVGDVNADGNPDLAVASRGSDKVTLLLGSGRGGFQDAGTLATGRAPTRVAAGDLNGDGIADLAVTCARSGAVRVFLSRQPLPAAASGRVFVRVRESTGGTGAYTLGVAPVDDHPATCEAATARVATDGTPAAGVLDMPGDVDYLAFDAEAGRTYTIETQLRGLADARGSFVSSTQWLSAEQIGAHEPDFRQDLNGDGTVGPRPVEDDGAAAPPSGVIGYYRFSQGSGQSVIDGSATAVNGQLGLTSSVEVEDPVWRTGRLGMGLTLDGLDDLVTIPANSALNAASAITIEAWVNRSGEGSTWQPIVARSQVAQGGRVWGLWVNPSGALAAAVHQTNVVTTDGRVPVGRWTHVAAVMSPGTGLTSIYVDGQLVASGLAPASFPNLSSVPLTIGASDRGIGFRSLLGQIDEVVVYGRSLTAAEVAARVQSAGPIPAPRPAPNCPPGAGGFLAFEEGAGQVVEDGASSGNSSVLGVGPSADSADPAWETAGLSGKTLSFDGADDQLTVTLNSTLSSATALTVEGWVRRSGEGTTWQAIVARSQVLQGGRVWGLWVSPSGALAAAVGSSNVVTTADRVPVGRWTHVAAVMSPGTGLTSIYVDGQLVASDQAPAAFPNFPSVPVTIGASDRGIGFRSFLGLIDEIVFYPRALTGSELAARAGPAPARQPAPNCPPGAGGFLALEEGTGQVVEDGAASGNFSFLGFGPTADSADPAWETAGVSGKALSFDGADDQLTVTLNSTLSSASALTVEGWVRRSGEGTTWQAIVARSQVLQGGRVWGLWVSPSGALAAAVGSSNVVTTADRVLVGRWTHVAAVMSPGTGLTSIYVDGQLVASGPAPTAFPNLPSVPVTIGASDRGIGFRSFLGLIDEIVFHPRALTGSELAARAAAIAPPAPPPVSPGSSATPGAVAVLHFDEDTGQTVADASGAGNGGHRGTTTSADPADPAWSNGGLAGRALSFDGDDDVAIVTGNSTLTSAPALTVEAWVNRSGSGTTWQAIVTRSQVTQDGRVWGLWVSPSGALAAAVGSSNVVTPDFQVPVRRWTHVAAVMTPGQGPTIVYVNGRQVASGPAPDAFPSLPSVPLTIGASDRGVAFRSFLGRIDEVVVYSRALTSVELAARANARPPVASAPTGALALLGFEEGTGQPTADGSGSGNSGFLGIGTAADGADPAWTPGGAIGNALSFDGDDDQVAVNASGGLAAASAITVECWVHRSGAGGAWQAIATRSQVTQGGRVWGLWVSSSGGLAAAVGSMNVLTANNVVPIGRWTHVAAVLTPGQGTTAIHVDGRRVASGAAPGSFPNLSSVPLTVGASDRGYDGIKSFMGQIDELGVYGRALTDDEIQGRADR